MNTRSKKPIKIRISDGDRFARLANMGEVVFTIQDLATIWNISNRSTLRMTLARYIKRGLIFSIWRGLYSILDPKKIDPLFLGIKALHAYAYISCETVLFDAGLINQPPREITIVSNVSRRFSILGREYRVRKMSDTLLYNDTGIIFKNGIRIATSSRAKKDMLYFSPKKYYDANI